MGDCVWAGAANETMKFASDQEISLAFNDQGVISDYTAVTGYNPHDKKSDQGTVVSDAADYRRKTGVVDALGNRHKLDAYCALNKGDINQLKFALYYLGGAGIGFEFPDYAFEQFDAPEPWDVKAFDKLKGGHYVPGFGINQHGNIVCVSWGREQEMTPEFYKVFSDEAYAYLDLERLKNQISPEGFNYTLLKDWLASLT